MQQAGKVPQRPQGTGGSLTTGRGHDGSGTRVSVWEEWVLTAKIDPADVMMARNVSRASTAYRAAIKLLHRHLFAGEPIISVTYGDRNKVAIPSFQNHLNRYFVPWLVRVAQDLDDFGYAPVRLTQCEAETNVVPVVPDATAYEVHIFTSTLSDRTRLRYFSVPRGSYDDSIIFLQEPGCEPTITTQPYASGGPRKTTTTSGSSNGLSGECAKARLNSRSFSLVPAYNNLANLETAAVAAEQMRVYSGIVVQQNPRADLRRGGGGGGDGGDGGVATDPMARSTVLRSVFQTSAQAAQSKIDEDRWLVEGRARQNHQALTLSAELARGDRPQSRTVNAAADPSVLSAPVALPSWSDRPMLPLPDGVQLAAPTLPQGRSDLVALRRQFEEQVYTVVGVPRVLMSAEGAFSQSIDSANGLFNQLLAAWASMLQTMCKQIYELIYAVPDAYEAAYDLEVQRQLVADHLLRERREIEQRAQETATTVDGGRDAEEIEPQVLYVVRGRPPCGPNDPAVRSSAEPPAGMDGRKRRREDGEDEEDEADGHEDKRARRAFGLDRCATPDRQRGAATADDRIEQQARADGLVTAPKNTPIQTILDHDLVQQGGRTSAEIVADLFDVPAAEFVTLAARRLLDRNSGAEICLHYRPMLTVQAVQQVAESPYIRQRALARIALQSLGLPRAEVEHALLARPRLAVQGSMPAPEAPNAPSGDPVDAIANTCHTGSGRGTGDTGPAPELAGRGGGGGGGGGGTGASGRAMGEAPPGRRAVLESAQLHGQTADGTPAEKVYTTVKEHRREVVARGAAREAA